MRDNRPQLIENLFSDDSIAITSIPLLKLQQRAILLLKLNRSVNELLPTVLRPWCRVANIRQKILILEVANAAWQMRLRSEQSQLLSLLKVRILPSLSSISIKINPTLMNEQKLITKNSENAYPNFQKPIEKPRRLSVHSAAFIYRVATTCSEGNLKNTLERLAQLAGRT